MSSLDDHFLVHSHDGNAPLELRCIHPQNLHGISGGTRIKLFAPKDYSTPLTLRTAFHNIAILFNQQGFNAYTPVNIISTDFNGTTPEGKPKSVRKDDIVKRKHLLVDADRKGNPKNPATDEELARAEEVVDKVEIYLAEQGWADPHKVMSGSGYHLYFPLDNLENSKEVTTLIKETLEMLAGRFNNDYIKIDTIVADAPRITKVIGTVARKGSESHDRPYRTVRLCK